ncbi:MAG: hypothetical protein U9P10_08330, partial [Thermodesulfobacteriota bacterium]|nr:hypothetical protein [Thermodesulfobacteriota bacterium]
LFEDQWPQFLIFSLAGKKSSVVLVPDRQPLGAAVFKKLDDRVTANSFHALLCLSRHGRYMKAISLQLSAVSCHSIIRFLWKGR